MSATERRNWGFWVLAVPVLTQMEEMSLKQLGLSVWHNRIEKEIKAESVMR